METAIKIKSITIALAQFLGIISIIILAQVVFKNQFITGTIINALLICSVFFLGLRQSIGIAIIPSLFSVFTGLMAPVILPFVPFIILGNIILVVTINYLKNSYFLAGAIGAILKFSFLFLTSAYLFSFLPEPILYAMSYPQLITAFLGVGVSFIILKIAKKI
ncbi:MAG: hypothetical protein PHG24_00365 [Candidatus Pacebacteria bacterium]|nr:hypothetical protein [Candidatus Paceibacterota bacterium]